jgi:hypothetical protein
VRVFLKHHLRAAREAGRAAPGDLAWIEAQGQALLEQTLYPDANGVALFAGEALGLREMLSLRVPFEDTFVVEARPYLRPLAQVIDDTPAALVVFIDGTSARLIPLDAAGPEDELLLQTEVEGRHRTGGWAARGPSRSCCPASPAWWRRCSVTCPSGWPSAWSARWPERRGSQPGRWPPGPRP